MVGMTSDVYGSPSSPGWDDLSFPIVTLPIDLLPCCNLPPCDDEDDDCDGDNDNQN